MQGAIKVLRKLTGFWCLTGHLFNRRKKTLVLMKKSLIYFSKHLSELEPCSVYGPIKTEFSFIDSIISSW